MPPIVWFMALVTTCNKYGGEWLFGKLLFFFTCDELNHDIVHQCLKSCEPLLLKIVAKHHSKQQFVTTVQKYMLIFNKFLVCSDILFRLNTNSLQSEPYTVNWMSIVHSMWIKKYCKILQQKAWVLCRQYVERLCIQGKLYRANFLFHIQGILGLQRELKCTNGCKNL